MAILTTDKLVTLSGLTEFKTKYTDKYIGDIKLDDGTGTQKLATVKDYVDAKVDEGGDGSKVTIEKTTGTASDAFLEKYAVYQGVKADDTAEQKAAKKLIDIETPVVTVEKQATAETGYAATYYIKQNGTKVGDSINIAKDWLLKNVELKTCTVADTPIAGLKVGDKYFDFSFNVKAGGDETVEHVYLNVNDLYDSYTSGSVSTDAIVITVDNDKNEISASITDATIARSKIDSDFEDDIKALEDTHAAKTEGSATVFKTVSEQIKEEAKDAVYKAETTPGAGDGLTIAAAIKKNADDISALTTATTAEIDALFA